MYYSAVNTPDKKNNYKWLGINNYSFVDILKLPSLTPSDYKWKYKSPKLVLVHVVLIVHGQTSLV